MKERIYKISIHSFRGRKLYLSTLIAIIIFLIIVTILGAIKDYQYTKNLTVSYRNILTIESKKDLNKDRLTIKDWIKIVNREPGNFYIYIAFIQKLLNLNISQELKFNFVIYSLDIFDKIKLSPYFLDLRALILTYWMEDREEILKILKKSIDIKSDISIHKILFNKYMIKNYSDYIINLLKNRERTIIENGSFFIYLLKSKKYDILIDLLLNKKVNFDKEMIYKNLAKYLTLIKDQNRAEKIFFMLKKEIKKDYIYHYFAQFYYNKIEYNKAIEIIKEMKKDIKNYNQIYLINMINSYEKLGKYKLMLDTILEFPPDLLKKYCYLYIKGVNYLNNDLKISYFKRVEFICDKKIIYKQLIKHYKNIGDKDKMDQYKFQYNLLK